MSGFNDVEGEIITFYSADHPPPRQNSVIFNKIMYLANSQKGDVLPFARISTNVCNGL